MSSLSYLALGDSYTIGEAVFYEENYPSQLVNTLRNEYHIPIESLKIIATTGWTTDELLEGIEKEKPGHSYSMVSLLIGVNNQYRGYPANQFTTEFKLLLEKAISFTSGQPEKVMVVAIPDYGCTPFGKEKAGEIHQDLLWYNEEARNLASGYGIRFCDIFSVSGLAAERAELTASDGLHPSAGMYAKWVELMIPFALSILKNQQS